jgi:mRNA interferase RelE/StbE
VSFTLQFKPAALRQMAKLPRDLQKRIALRVESLRELPFPPGCKKFHGEPYTWRIRVGDYRVIYQVQAGALLVLVVMIGHRREIYR